jgi:cell division septation protein DedD
MSDAMVPSYRLHRPTSAFPGRLVAWAGGVRAFVAAGGAGWWAIQRIGARSVPLVEADPRPFKVRPSDPGGLRVPNQGELVLERPGQRQPAAAGGRAPGLAPEAEAPNIDRLRAAVAPPPVVAPAPVWPPPGQGRPGGQPATAQAPAPAQAPPAAAQAPAPATTAQAPAPPAAEAARPPAVGTGRVQVQLAALTSEDGARSEWERIGRRAPELFQGRSPSVMRLEREGQSPLFRLRTGGFADQTAAREFCEQVRARGATCIPVR